VPQPDNTTDFEGPSILDDFSQGNSNTDESALVQDSPIVRPKLYNRAMLLLKLKEERRLPQVTIDNLVSDVGTLLEEELLSLKYDIGKCLQENDASMELSTKINETITQRIGPSPFQGIHTAYLQQKYYSEHFNLVVSIMYIHRILYSM